MSHTTPATYLMWAILSSLLGAFLVFHLWKYDRFKCLRWNTGPYSGAFKRIMTYTYLLDTPLLIGYSVGYSIIKYRVGYTYIPELGIQPTPWELWPSSYQSWIFPLNLLFSIAWGLEMVTHLEELCFWLFLMNAGAIQQDWFRSAYFRTWIVGSVSAVAYMPLVTIFTRSDPLRSEAFTFLAGSIGSLSLTLWFTPILFTFPAFLKSLRVEGVDGQTIVRLTKFHELNCIRVIFRFMFCIPLLILGVDGVRPHQHINDSMFGTELLAFLAALGCVISSGITLVIFFPRSIEGEIEAKSKSAARRSQRLRTIQAVQQSERDSYFSLSSPVKLAVAGDDVQRAPAAEWPKSPSPVTSFPEKERMLAPNRRTETGAVVLAELTEGNLQRLNHQTSNVNPFVHNFTSPIDLVSRPASNVRWSAQHRHTDTRV